MKKNTVLAKIMGASDGCTHAPDFNFYDCCAEHDFYYSKNSDEPRFLADLKLAYCIYKKGHILLALIYFSFVRRFGAEHYEASGDRS